MNSPIKKVVEHLGSQRKLAICLKVSDAAISKWVKTGEIPIRKVPIIYSLLGGKMSHHELRPDIFPPA